MMFNDPMAREAYRQGARASYESLVLHCDAPNGRAVEFWLSELDAWEVGDPPAPPFEWEPESGVVARLRP